MGTMVKFLKLKYVVNLAVDFVKGSDRFTKPVSLTFENSTSFKTFIGGFITLGLYIGFAIFIISQLKLMMGKTQMETTKSEKYVDVSTDDLPHYPGLNGFNFAFRLYHYSYLSPEEEKRYFHYEAWAAEFKYDEATKESKQVWTQYELQQ